MHPPSTPASADLVLENGLHVRLHHEPRLKHAAAFMRVAAGSHDVPAAWPGLAHFLEHLFFLGTDRYNGDQALMTFVQNHGGQINASTRERCTDYFFELPIQAFPGAVERLCDMLAHPRMTQAEQLREREVLHAEFVAWSRDPEARQLLWLTSALDTEHPLRAFHAGNRYSLPVPRDSFQQDLRTFYRRFYQTGQMTLSLVGPQPLEQLRAIAVKADAALRQGDTAEQAPPPPLCGVSGDTVERPDTSRFNLAFACENLLRGADQALDFLGLWLGASQSGGLLAELRRRGLVHSVKLNRVYSFAEQALIDIEFKLTPSGETSTDLISQLCFDWLEYFQAHDDWQSLRDEYALLNARRLQVGSALDLARHHSDGAPCELSAHAVQALRDILERLRPEHVLHGPARPATADLGSKWRMPPRNRFLRPSRRPDHTVSAPPSMTFVHGTSPNSSEAAVYLRWRLNASRHLGLFRILEDSLRKLTDEAGQAGVTLSFISLGDDWQLRLSGVQAPMPALLEHALEQLAVPAPEVWHLSGQEPASTPLTPIRELLKRLPEHSLGYFSSRTSDEDLRPLALQKLWNGAQWDGLAVGLAEGESNALNAALRKMPGSPNAQLSQPAAPQPGRSWSSVACHGTSENALLLFCPTPSQSIADEAAWRLLAHLCQAPFYQRLRVELQLGYAVFSGLRQVAGRTGLVFGVQSPQASLPDILEHVESFIDRLPTLLNGVRPATFESQRSALASRYVVGEMELPALADLAWQALLAGRPADYLASLHQALLDLQPADVQRAAQQLIEADGGWLCLANGDAPGPAWGPVKRSLPNR
ncbi:pyrroloquinoline quinone biosynthesis protein PqqF [Pseudomonas sp. UBA4194]|uniref:pyrroloquinoline quinone biosynthesis protein PqqF n=1 Tax=Pseudomonas sp. UBA4194 TaxID=1947317 RepID=UPI0025E76183|nr:pyrroloquinoline quinone biosynthesis protein PqqF [Pseudomonas sp. UBA4194]